MAPPSSCHNKAPELALQGVEPQRTLVELGTPAAEEAEIRWLDEHRSLLDGPTG